MNMIVGTAVMTATASKVNAEGSSIDAELVALSEKVLELLPAYEAAAKRAGEIYDEFEKLAPVRDAALLWRLGDPIRIRHGRSTERKITPVVQWISHQQASPRSAGYVAF